MEEWKQEKADAKVDKNVQTTHRRLYKCKRRARLLIRAPRTNGQRHPSAAIEQWLAPDPSAGSILAVHDSCVKSR
jgi:hypothetical protein